MQAWLQGPSNRLCGPKFPSTYTAEDPDIDSKRGPTPLSDIIAVYKPTKKMQKQPRPCLPPWLRADDEEEIQAAERAKEWRAQLQMQGAEKFLAACPTRRRKGAVHHAKQAALQKKRMEAHVSGKATSAGTS